MYVPFLESGLVENSDAIFAIPARPPVSGLVTAGPADPAMSDDDEFRRPRVAGSSILLPPRFLKTRKSLSGPQLCGSSVPPGQQFRVWGLCRVQLGGCAPLSLPCAEAELSATTSHRHQDTGGGVPPQPNKILNPNLRVRTRLISDRRSGSGRVEITGEGKAPFRRLDFEAGAERLCNCPPVGSRVQTNDVE